MSSTEANSIDQLTMLSPTNLDQIATNQLPRTRHRRKTIMQAASPKNAHLATTETFSHFTEHDRALMN
jgi:hypothetical protein